jgi:hypothetical protein
MKDKILDEQEPLVDAFTSMLKGPPEEIDDGGSPTYMANGIILPSRAITIRASARALFAHISASEKLFLRGGKVQRVVENKLETLMPDEARSEFEKHTGLWAWRVGRGGKWVLEEARIAKDMAAAFLACDEACNLLPRINGLINCPVLVTHDGEVQVVGPGYHGGTGLFITGGEMPEEVRLTEAIALIKDLVAEFDFQSLGDRSRALASFITPALKLGGHLRGNVPVDVAEADQSQSGKTYRQRLGAAVYNEKPSLVTSRKGGVGSVDESLDAQLIAGRPFVQLDNFRGKLDSQHIEAFLTAEQTFTARVPYRGGVQVDPSRFFIMLSSNGVETTRDFANRASIIRNRKREGLAFKKYIEGDLLEHVRTNQHRYLGAVFAIVREWIGRGCRRTDEVVHDFREWSQALDWIVQNILGEAPLMGGHREEQVRVSNPDLTFLRNIALAVAENKRLKDWLSASTLYAIAVGAEIDIPGLQKPDEEAGRKLIGMVMARIFKAGDTATVDAFTVIRQETETERTGGRGGSFTMKMYEFDKTE